MTRLGEFNETKLTAAIAAAAIFAISILGAHTALASNAHSTYCTERPWQCAPEAHAIVTAIHHSIPDGGGYPGVRRSTIVRFPVRNNTSNKHKSHGAFLSDLVPQLSAKVAEIIGRCGSKLVSAFRPGAVVAGTHKASLHSTYPARAADLSGHPGCIYSMLHGWPGGYSVDYAKVRHVHVSLDLIGHREFGARFIHGGGHYAHSRHHHRKAAHV